MKNLHFIFFLIIALLLAGCSDDEDIIIKPSPFDTPVVSGYEARDHIGNTIGIYGNPNIKNSAHSEEGGFRIDFYLYPNPVNEFFSVYVNMPNNDKEKHVWIVPAIYQGEPLPSNSDMGMINFCADGSPVIDTTFRSKYLTLDVSHLETGFYKVYVEVENTILHDNLVKINQ